MNLWTTVLLAWVSVNLILVALMWRYQWMKERSARQRSASQSASSAHGSPLQPCVRAASGWTCQPPAAAEATRTVPIDVTRHRPRVISLTSADAAAPTWRGATTRATSAGSLSEHASCRMQELRDEIRVLKLTVAELALEKAMLSAAVSRRKALS